MTHYGFLSTYPPTRCGLATFTEALAGALAGTGTREPTIVRVLDSPIDRPGPTVVGRIPTTRELIAGDRVSLGRVRSRPRGVRRRDRAARVRHLRRTRRRRGRHAAPDARHPDDRRPAHRAVRPVAASARGPRVGLRVGRSRRGHDRERARHPDEHLPRHADRRSASSRTESRCSTRRPRRGATRRSGC